MNVDDECVCARVCVCVRVQVPKAGSSTSRSLAQRFGGRSTTYDSLTEAQKGYFTFAFVRDPVSRLESG